MMDAERLHYYLDAFGKLSRNVNKEGQTAPHKPILLLALLDEIQKRTYTENFIPITPELVASFRAYWRTLVPAVSSWRSRIVYPFRYLRQNGFWDLTHNGIVLSSGDLGEPTSISQMNGIVDGGRFTDDLWELLQDTVALNALRAHLLQTYFGATTSTEELHLPSSSLNYEIEKLKAEAHSKYKLKKAHETSDSDGDYVRHALFPRVVKSLYHDACCVCGLATSSSQGDTIVDAAHIVPFAVSHNDDPRNGLAFCKNHHWGFDAGWFSVSAEYKLIVSPHLQNGLTYITKHAPLLLPADANLFPAPAALAWHLTHRFQK